MIKISITLFLTLFIGLTVQAQTTRYFEFSTICGHGNWQDTTFIASASDQVLIDTVLANLARPIDQRKFINGLIDYGNGGHNHNATHWFLWHFIPNQWELVEATFEVCDGCPYSDVDADTATWVGILGQFCPWSGRPVREVSKPLSINKKDLENDIILYPNPAQDEVSLKCDNLIDLSVTIYNSFGQELSATFLPNRNNSIRINHLQDGVYFLKIIEGGRIGMKTLIIDRK